MRCFYHATDLDGHCSGAIVKREFLDCEMYPINYGQDFPWDEIKKNDVVFMVDFALQPFSDMLKLSDMCSLVWIDHHKTAMAEYEKHGMLINGLRRNGVGACQLVWEHIYKTFLVPYPVRLLAQYDVWDHSDPASLPFQYGLRIENTDPLNQELWEKLFSSYYDNIIDLAMVPFYVEVFKQGEIVLKYEEQYNEKYALMAFETEIDGLKCIAINKMLCNSKLFDSIWNPEKHDAMLAFGFRKEGWTVSLYSDKPNIDVSKIAKNRGGGGHKGAAGFQCKNLPFKL